jgi:hypothetical protein
MCVYTVQVVHRYSRYLSFRRRDTEEKEKRTLLYMYVLYRDIF